MRTWVLLALAIAAIHPITDWLVDSKTAEHGYTQAESNALGDLIERESAGDWLSEMEVALYVKGKKI